MIELKALQTQVKHLVDDLRRQVTANDGLRSNLRQEHVEAKAAERVGVTFETWLEGVLDQAAVAWVLGCVFVRFCEDNSLIDKVWIGGPTDAASVERATQARQAYLIANPLHNDSHWLGEAFTYMQGLRATSKIFDKHSPVFRFAISGDAAQVLSDFFRRGDGLESLHSDGLDTRFLGDLYQDLSAYARSTYALLQTPVFVEEFILDRAFEPAVAEFGLSETSVIDPTCGSGHFLLGAFHRLVAKWQVREPATPIDALVERALGQVTGVDINPFAVAIARFRLVVAALKATGRTNLNNSYPVRVAAGDSLLTWGEQSRHQGDLLAELEGRPAFAYYTEDGDLLANYLKPGLYTVVVGNPPYITVKDRVLSDRYRTIYSACSGQYHMTVPFAQRFFSLAKRGDHEGDGSGWIGQITGNGFMKREFGKKLINEFFASQVELDEVIDTSGAYIPSHGTPTVILVGRNRPASARYSGPIRTILGIRGEPSQPSNPAEGLVWTAIVDQISQPGSQSEWISAAETGRQQLAAHPWSLSGGGASALQSALVRESRLEDLIDSIGRTTVVGDDDAWMMPNLATARRLGEGSYIEPFVIGESVRDFSISEVPLVRRPYTDQYHTAALPRDHELVKHLWPVRTTLRARSIFGRTIEQQGRVWYEHLENYASKLRTPMSIAFSFVATHNHFVLDRGGKVFKQSAPVIKLPQEASEDDHLRLLGVLNSSTACFWLKQVSHDKGNRGGERSTARFEWEHFYEFTGTKLQEFPLPAAYPLQAARTLDGLATHLGSMTPVAVAASAAPTRDRLAEAHVEYDATLAQMIALQEELDWQVYQLYGILDEDLTTPKPPELRLGERAFEIVLARSIKEGSTETQWFARHGSTPITELPHDWSDDYRQLVERRIAVIESDRNIALIERPECKRRWSSEGWDAMQATALRDWLLDRLEAPELWGSTPAPLSVAQIADRMRHDDDFRSVLDLWTGTDQHDLTKTLSKLIADEHVPYLPAARYKADGLRKRSQWERTWALQRREDAGEKVEIAVPPKYTSADFTKPSYWRNRGKLDVPKERFISYPQMGRTGDASELLGWAGWDHLAQAQALATVYLNRKTHESWPVERLLPMLAGIAELEPWLIQWHDEPKPGYPSTPAAFYSGLLDTELAALGADRKALTQLRGVEELS
jgi:hypothetical protein